MGRYVRGNFSWKFAFADQSSSFGEVLESICDTTEECYCDRFIGTKGQGEQVELYIGNAEELIEACQDFVGSDFVVKDNTKWCNCEEKFGNDYWDKLMIRKFLKEVDLKGNEGEYLNFYVEY